MDLEQRAEYLVNKYADTVLRLSYTYLKNTADAQDICQEVMLKLVQSDRTFDSGEHEKAWVLRVTANACKDVLKSAWRSRTCGLDGCGEAAAVEESESEVLAAVKDLPDIYRAVIYLYYYEGYHAEEIGQILNVPAATVTTRLSRGREKLKWMLKGAEYEQQRV